MLLWLFFAVMTAGTLAAVLRPLARPASSPAATMPATDAGTLAVYRDQLDEIEAERARGVLDAGEAEAARLEVSRRLLALADQEKPQAVTSRPGRARKLTLGIAACVPLLTLGFYLAYGSPGMPAQPYAARSQEAALQGAQVTQLVAKVEARLREAPQDGKGWDVIAPVYFKLGRFRDAANAYLQAGRLLGDTVSRLGGFAESSVFAADGIVTEEARAAYARILELEPGRVEPRFWLALAKEQEGDLAGAKADYDGLLASAPADAPWRASVEERSRAIAGRLAGAVAKRGPDGPSQDEIAAAERMAPADRQRMIENMVEGLAQRLKKDGRDLAGWVRLVRAYGVLQRTDEARAALAEARKVFAGDERAMGELAQLAASMGLGT